MQYEEDLGINEGKTFEGTLDAGFGAAEGEEGFGGAEGGVGF